MFVSRGWNFLTSGRRFVTKVPGESSPLIRQLDIHVSPENSLPKVGKSKLRKKLEAQSSPELTKSQLGALQSAEEEILEVLEECLRSNAMIGAFPHFQQSSKLVHISKVKVNRDLSHIDVIWGSTILETFVQQVYESHGKQEGMRIRDKIFKKTNLQLQKKEGTFRTFLMRTVDFRRVPRYLSSRYMRNNDFRIFFRPPEEAGQEDDNSMTFDDWRKEQLEKEKKLKAWAEINEGSHGLSEDYDERIENESSSSSSEDATSSDENEKDSRTKTI